MKRQIDRPTAIAECAGDLCELKRCGLRALLELERVGLAAAERVVVVLGALGRVLEENSRDRVRITASVAGGLSLMDGQGQVESRSLIDRFGLDLVGGRQGSGGKHQAAHHGS